MQMLFVFHQNVRSSHFYNFYMPFCLFENKEKIQHFKKATLIDSKIFGFLNVLYISHFSPFNSVVKKYTCSHSRSPIKTQVEPMTT